MNPFPPKFINQTLEYQFAIGHLQENLISHRVSVFIAMISLGLFSLIDYFFFPWGEAKWLILSRGAAWVGFITLIILSYLPKSIQHMKTGYPITVVWVGLTILSNFFITKNPIVYEYYVGVIISMLYGYIFIRTNWYYAVFTGTFLEIVFLFTSIRAGFPTSFLLTSNMFIFVANIFGLMGNYAIEFTSRKEYWRSEQLAQEEENLRILNQQLDQLLIQQTEKLKNSNAFISEFNTGVGIDLKSPLRSTRQYLELLNQRNGAVFDQFSKEYLNELLRLNAHMISMIDSLINYSHIQELHRSHTHINTDMVLEIVKRRLRTAIKSNAAIIQSDPLPTVIGDEGLLVILFTNLISNALQYRSEKRPEIRVSAQKNDQETEWVFCITDNGMGISESDQPKLFGFFTRFNRTIEIAGIGMGLATSKRIVELHQGKIWFESVIDQGTKVYFSLPCVEIEK